jgi:ubiquinone/menaquinone biosynthesis C-methylase UbiE
MGDLKDSVRKAYSEVAEKGTSCCNSERLEDRGYESNELAMLLDTVVKCADGCGNPTAITSLKEGEVAVDLGSGAGIDVFLAAKRVGATGRVIGVDMTDKMLEKARENAKALGVTNVEFRKGEIENLPIDSSSVDVVFSNCVINLSPDKDAVFKEAARVLKPGGRIAISDIVSQVELPGFLKKSEGFWSVCGGGALLEPVYLSKIRAAGFEKIHIVSRYNYKSEEILQWTEGRFKPTAQEREAIEALNEKLSSITVTASKSNSPR